MKDIDVDAPLVASTNETVNVSFPPGTPVAWYNEDDVRNNGVIISQWGEYFIILPDIFSTNTAAEPVVLHRDVVELDL